MGQILHGCAATTEAIRRAIQPSWRSTMQMFARDTYLNIHTSVVPGGEIRGFLVQAPEPATLELFGAGVLSVRRARKTELGFKDSMRRSSGRRFRLH
jgi:hypothetical protein